MDPLTRNRIRVAQSRTARQRALSATPRTLPTAASRSGAPYLPGERVFDSATGLDGTVTACSRVSTPGAATVCVRLDDGSSVTREPGLLIGRPTPPAAE